VEVEWGSSADLSFSRYRIFLGRNAVMRKGLGATPEDECRLGVHKVANVRFLSLLPPFLAFSRRLLTLFDFL
jgi:hypothetical protein